jgi:hypothetical protein
MPPTGVKIFGWTAPGELGGDDNVVDPAIAAVEAADGAKASPAPAPRPKDGRSAKRNRVLMDGTVVYAQGARSIDCSIRDLSEAGARVRLSGPEPMPEQVMLIHMRTGTGYEATVAWARDRDLGLTFIAAHRLDENCPPTMAPLRRLWLARQPR